MYAINRIRSLRFFAQIGAAAALLLIALGLFPAIQTPILSLFALSSTVVQSSPAAGLGLGIAGAVLAGWVVTIHYLGRRIERLDAKVLGTALLRGLLTWFVLDGIVSLANGFAYNVLFNTGFLALGMVPVFAILRTTESKARGAA